MSVLLRNVRRPLVLWMPLFALLTITSGFVDLRMRAHPEVAVTVYVPQVLNGTAEPPGRYRVLAPFVVQAVADCFHVSLQSAWYITRLAWFLAAFVIFHAYLCTWFRPGTAFGGTALLAAILPLTYTNSTMHPDHIPELALVSAGCLAVVRGRDAWFALLLVLAALNRETSAFLVAFYLLARPLTPWHILRTSAFGLLWLVVFVGLRAWLGFAMYDYWQLWRNIGFLGLLPPNFDPYYRAYAYFVVLLVACLGTIAIAHWQHYPRSIRAGLGVVPLVLLAGCAISSIIETRIFTPLLPFMLPAVLVAVTRADQTPDSIGASPSSTDRVVEADSRRAQADSDPATVWPAPPRAAMAISNTRLLAWLLPGIAVALYYEWSAWQSVGTLGFPLDDAWIHAQFARNLATGQGFTYSAGRWVAGSTAPGWTLLLAVGYFGLRSVLLSATLLGLLLQLTAGVFAARLTSLLTDDLRLGVMAGLAVMLTPVMTWGAVSGMEVPLSGALVLAGYYMYLSGRTSGQRTQWAGITLLALSCLARPENLVLLSVVSVHFAWNAGRVRQALTRAGLIVALSAVTFAPFVAFDYETTGKPLPTTFYAKSGPGLLRALSEGNTADVYRALLKHGPNAVLKFGQTIVDQLSLASLLVCAGVLLGLKRSVRERGAWLLAAALIIAPFAMGVTAPQRLKPENVRYTGQLVCLATVLAVVGVREVTRWIRWPGARMAIGTLLVAAVCWRSVAGAPLFALSVKNIQQLHVETASWIRLHLPPGSTVAVNDVGALAYFGGHTIVDIEGLVTPEALNYRGSERGLRFIEDVHPDYLVIFPNWYPEIAREPSRFEEVHRVAIPDNYIAGGHILVVYRTPWTRLPVIAQPLAKPKRARWPA